MFVTRKPRETVSSLKLLNIKLQAAIKYNKIINELDLLVTLDDQLKDFNIMTKNNFFQPNNRIQIFWSQKFAQSPWGQFITQHPAYVQDIEETIQSLIQLKQSYISEWQSLIDNPTMIKRDDFYRHITDEITKAESLLDNLKKFDLPKYKNKSNHMMDLAKESLSNAPVQGHSDKTLRRVLYRTKERELYLAYRKMINSMKNIASPLINDINQEKAISNVIVECTHQLSHFTNQLMNTSDPAELADIKKRYNEWYKIHHQDMHNIIELKQSMFECSVITYDFIQAMKNIEENIIKNISKLDKSFMFGNTAHRNSLLQNIVAMIKTQNYDHFDQIFSAVKHNSYNTGKIKGLNLYLKYLKRVRDRNIEQSTIRDYLTIYEDQLSLITQSKEYSADANIDKLHHPELLLLCHFDHALNEFNKHVVEKKNVDASPRFKF